MKHVSTGRTAWWRGPVFSCRLRVVLYASVSLREFRIGVDLDVDIKRRRFLVPVEPGILREVRKRAASRGITSESLV